jgi:hypothetical protein
MKIRPVEANFFSYPQTNMTKLIAALHNFAKAPESEITSLQFIVILSVVNMNLKVKMHLNLQYLHI